MRVQLYVLCLTTHLIKYLVIRYQNARNNLEQVVLAQIMEHGATRQKLKHASMDTAKSAFKKLTPVVYYLLRSVAPAQHAKGLCQTFGAPANNENMLIKYSKKIKILLYLPLALFFLANLFYYPLPAKAEESYKF